MKYCRFAVLQHFSFNAFQTGKRIERPPLVERIVKEIEVSIPFKRESASKESRQTRLTGDNFRVFQCLSNGKVHRKEIETPVPGCTVAFVSIPFKRESASKDKLGSLTTTPAGKVSIPFKRESASKGRYSQTPRIRKVDWVSIPFKRESASKVNFDFRNAIDGHHVSIPFKRESASKADAMIDFQHQHSFQFQFPSNGKVHRKNAN